MMLSLPRLYAITDLSLAQATSHVELVDRLLDGGCRLIQLRENTLADAPYFEQIERCRVLCQQAGARLILNDRADLAWAAAVHGIHLGQEDSRPAAARRVLGPGILIGRSTHTMSQALEAEADASVDYIAVGPVFSTSTKITGTVPLGLDELEEIRRRVRKPLVAIGGIGLENARRVLETGCDTVAVVSALMAAASISAATRRLIAAIAGCATRAEIVRSETSGTNGVD